MNGFELSIDVQSLKNAEQHLKSMVTYSEQLEKNLKNAINAVGSGNAKFLENLTGKLKEVQNTTVNIKTDNASLDKAATTIDRIVQDVSKLSGKHIFDPNALYTTTRSVAEVEKSIGDLKTKLATVDDDTKKTFKAPINEKTGQPYREQSKTYQKFLQEKIAIEKADLENCIKIEEQKLQWAKKTVGERLAAEEAHRKKMAAAEKKANKEVVDDYKKTTQEMINIMKTRDKLVKSGNAKPDQIKSLEAQFTQLNQHRLNLEAQYGAQVVNIAQQAQRRVWEIESKRIDDAKKKEQERLDAKRSTTSGAINFARSAVSVNQLEQAKGYLKTALGNEVDDKKLEKLRDAYTRVRIAIEEKTRSQKNETTLQPTVANEYARLLKEMDKVKKKQGELAKTQTYKSGNTQAQGDMSALVAREQDLQKRIQAIRTAAGGQLAEIDRKHAAETAAANLATYQQTEQRKTQIAMQQLKQRLEQSRKFGTVSTASANRLVDSTYKVKNASQAEEAIKKLEAVKKNLNKTDDNYASTLKRIDNAIAQHTRTVKMATDAQYRKNEAERQAYSSKKGTGQAIGAALSSSRNAKSIQDQIAAIQRLKQVRDSLDKGTIGSSAYESMIKRINKEIQRQQTEVDKLTNKHKQLGQQQSVLSKSAQQLQMRLAAVFGVAAIKGYINHLVQVRKTFELQHKSMQIILQDKDKADEIWNQTIQLATKSPFRVSELVGYTKQLAAYRIETDKLHDTTKRLADISAGVGVDMQRLILAYGQVRAAEYLRGTELRQFTEAGIPLLDELARYFTEIEGKTVSTAKVFDMISKRMVAFSDVEAVIQKMTNEGGVFFQMQEKQANTLYGLISNMHDQIDLMLNSIGGSHDGFMKSAVKSVTKLIKNWRDVGLAIELLLPQLGLVLIAQKAITLSMNEQKMAMMANIKFQKVWNGLLLIGKNIFMTMGVGALIAGITMLIVELTRAAREAARLREELGAIDTEVTKDFKEAVDTYKKLADAVNDATKSYSEQKEALGSLQRQFKDILPDRLLEIEYLKNTTDGYDEATKALKKYYNAKSIEKKKDKVEEVVGGDIRNEIERIFDEDTFVIRSESRRDLRGSVSIADKYGATTEEIQQIVEQVANEVKSGEIEINKWFIRLRERIAEFYSIPEDEAKRLSSKPINTDLLEGYLVQYVRQMDAITGTLYNSKSEKQMHKIYSQQKEGYDELIEKTKEYKRALEALKKARLDAKKDGIIKATEQLEIDAATQSVHNLYIELKRLAGFTDSGILTNAQLSKITDSQMGIEDEFVRVTELVSKKFKQAFPNNTLTEQLSEDIDTAVDKLKDSDFETAAKDLTRKIAEKFDVSLYKFDKLLGAFGKGREHSVKEVKTEIDETEKLIKAYDTALAKLPTYVMTAQAVEATMMKEFGFGAERRKELENYLKGLKELYPAIGGLQEKSNSGGTPKDWLPDVVKLVRDAHKEFEELNNTLSNTEAKTLTITKYSEAFATAIRNVPELKGMGLQFSELDFTTEQGTIKILESFLEKFPAKASKRAEKARLEIEKALMDIKGEIQLRTAKEADEKLQADIEKMFSDYEISVELNELGMPDDMQNYFFDVDTSSLDEISRKVQSEINAIQGEAGKEDRLKQLKEFQKKVTELENKENAERAKKYYEYSKKMMSDAARLKVEELKTIADIERTFRANEGDTEEEKKMKERAKNAALEGLKKQTDTSLAEQQWKSFKESDMFISIMGDLQATSRTTIDALIGHIESYQESWSKLPLDQMKEVIKQLEQLKEAQAEAEIEANPFEAARDIRRDIKADGRSKQQAEADMVASQENIQAAKERLKLIEAIQRAQEQGLKIDGLRNEYAKKYNVVLDGVENKIEDQKAAVENTIDNEEKRYKTSKEQVNNYSEQQKAWQKQADTVGKVLDISKNLHGAYKSLYTALGGDENSPAAVWTDTAFQMVECILNTIMMNLQLKAATANATGFAAAMNTAMGIIGWIVMAIELIAMGLTAAFRVHDNKIEKKIEKEREKVEQLEKAYEKLEKVVEDAYNISTLDTAGTKAVENIEEQIKSREKMIKLEQDKKKTDDDKIKEWRNEIEDLQEQRAEMEKKLFSTATGGIVDNVRDVAKSFTDAWLEAFRETGDGLEGLTSEFDDAMKEMLVQQAAMTVVSPFIEKMKQNLQQAMNTEDGYTLDVAELKAVIDQTRADLPVMSELLERLFNEFEAAGFDVMGGKGELGGLQAGIQGITEDQADILAAYWSSVRFMVSNIDTTLTKLAEHTFSMVAQNPIVEQLKIIVTQVSGINTIINSLLTPHPTQAGYGLKVVL